MTKKSRDKDLAEEGGLGKRAKSFDSSAIEIPLEVSHTVLPKFPINLSSRVPWTSQDVTCVQGLYELARWN